MSYLYRVSCGFSRTAQEECTSVFKFGHLACSIQKRWKKPVISAQMRLEDRTRDLKFDKLMRNLRRLKIVLRLQELILDRKSPYVSVQILSKWRRKVTLNIGMGIFLRKYPHIFEIFTHPVKRNVCCRLTRKMIGLIEDEKNVISEMELANVWRLKKLVMISTNGSLHIHAIRLITRELGLPDDFKESIILKYPNDFRMVDNEIFELVSRDENLAVAEIEKWREKEYREKWLSEFETRYAFQIQFPTGYKIERDFREKMRNWQRLPYLKPYEKPATASIRVRSCGGVARFEKRAVGILHELLSLTVEKMIDVERISHFRKDFGMEINVCELLLKHPGIFYISAKGNTQAVFLREAYSKGNLIEPNPVYVVRRKILDLLLLGQRCSAGLRSERNDQLQRSPGVKVKEGPRDGDWVLPILDGIESDAVGGDSSNEDDESLYDLFEEVGADSIGDVGDDREDDDSYFTSTTNGDSCIEK